ncbi:MAG: undecaprenyl/decaprenyl-phosphate alpha-N-acetylglucosaminyl 1-phosphate transferase, partial [Planctomycetaceae bacterium]|nr:undecaprenyl/decaprenyl-phosphate alpha-N-acetylglucosaminyl 1-phosphate transferase [Planctomycetaceae bacterium]
INVSQTTIFGLTVSFGDVAPVITVLCLVGAVNALNLIDGVDGLAATTGIVLSLSFAGVTYIAGGRPDGLMISLVLAGALSGFLIYNFPPAKLFLGDSGSMLIGLLLGAVGLKCSLRQYAAATLILPTVVCIIPIFDVSMAIVRRKLTGRSIYETDHGHLHHCLQRKGFRGWRLLALTGGLCALTGLGAVLATVWKNDLIALTAAVTALSLLILTRSFGHTEMSLLANRARRFASSIVRRTAPAEIHVLHDENTRLTGDRDWESLWKTLTEFAARFNLDSVEMLVNLPRIGEEYHASWRRKSDTASHEEWRSEIPLVVHDMRVGQLKIVGAVGKGSICGWMSELIGGLQSIERELTVLVEDLRRERPGVAQSLPGEKPAEAEDAATEDDAVSDLSDSQQFALNGG